MEDIIEIRKYQNITDRLSRLMKSPRSNPPLMKPTNYHQHSSNQSDQKNYDLKNILDRHQQSNNQDEIKDQSNAQIETIRKIKSQDKLKKMLNQNITKQNLFQESKSNNQAYNIQENSQLIDKKRFFKDSTNNNKYQNQITKIIDSLTLDEELNFNKKQFKNYQNKNQQQLWNSVQDSAQLSKAQTKRPKFQFQNYQNTSKRTQDSRQNQQKKQKAFGKSRHLHHKSTAQFNNMGRVKSQNRSKLMLIESIKTEESYDQINIIEPTLRYSTLQEDSAGASFKLQRNKSDFMRVPGRICRNK